MKKLKATISTGFVGGTHELEIEVPDDFTREEAEDEVMDFFWSEIGLDWNEEDFIPANEMVYKKED